MKFFLCCKPGVVRTRRARQCAGRQWDPGSLLTPCCTHCPRSAPSLAKRGAGFGTRTRPGTKPPGLLWCLYSTLCLWPSPAARGNVTQPLLCRAVQLSKPDWRMLVGTQKGKGCPAYPSSHSGGPLQVASTYDPESHVQPWRWACCPRQGQRGGMQLLIFPPIFSLSLDSLPKCCGGFGGKGPFCWRQNCPEGYELSRTTLAGEEGFHLSRRSGITGAGGCPGAPGALSGGNESWSGPVTGVLSTGPPGAAQWVSLLFPPPNKICKVLGNAKIFQSSERFAGAEICFTSLLYTSAFSQGLFKTSPKLLYSRVAAEKAPISRRVTFALRCAYLFIVYKSREQLNQTHSKIPSPMYTVIKGNLGACCTSSKTINLHILHKGPEYKYNNLLKLSSSTLVF